MRKRNKERERRMALSRKGEYLICRMFNGNRLGQHHCFDVRNCTKLFEVKTMRSTGVDLKIHIDDAAMERKVEWVRSVRSDKKLTPILIAVVVTRGVCTVYESPLKQHIRVNQMNIVADGIKLNEERRVEA